MSFVSVTTDSPFVAGRALSVNALTVDDPTTGVDVGGEFVADGPWPTTFNAVFGDQYQFAANGDITVAGGAPTRPTSGLVYPRTLS